MKVVIAGGTGSVGRRVAEDLAGRGHEVALLTRSPRPDVGHRQVRWDGRTIGAMLMRTDPALALTGRRCIPQRLLESGFAFEHPTFGDAVRDLTCQVDGL